MIDRGRLNEVRSGRRDRVVTAPAKVEQVRGGDNPWFELSLTEGRNRQIRKMFEEIGHHVEKIRRIGYGALRLDVPPGEFRELTAGEVTALGRAARGLKVTPKQKTPEFAQLKKPVPPKVQQASSSRLSNANPAARLTPLPRVSGSAAPTSEEDRLCILPKLFREGSGLEIVPGSLSIIAKDNQTGPLTALDLRVPKLLPLFIIGG